VTTKLNEACAALAKAVDGTHIAVTFDEGHVEIYWHGVTKIDCSPVIAAKVIPMLRQLETFGMKDC